jgi:transcriptional regulator with XRE-family HTH domain
MSVIARNQLASALRSLRKERSFTQTDVAENMEWSLSKVIRIENGTVGISVSDLRSLLAFFEVTFGRDELLELARGGKADRQRWWKAFHNLVPPQLLDLAAYEYEAFRVATFAPIAVPDLLQTEAYAFAVNNPDQDAVMFQLQRRSVALDAKELVFVLDESLLHRTPGGRMMLAGQLESILADSRRPGVSVYVLPYTAGAHTGWAGGFSIVSCDGGRYLTTAAGPSADPEAIHSADSRLRNLVARSLGLEASANLIREAVDRLR